jgi:hypothetical protein
LLFQNLGGEVDFAVLPRTTGANSSVAVSSNLSIRVDSRLGRFSTTLASAVEFFRHARELPSGNPAFDNAYQVLALPNQIQQSPLDATLVDRVLHWPANAIAPHSVLAWRDPFGLHVEARMPGPANWAAVSYFVGLAEDLCARLPGPLVPAQSPKFLDRIINRVLTS